MNFKLTTEDQARLDKYLDHLDRKYPDGPTNNEEYRHLYHLAHMLAPHSLYLPSTNQNRVLQNKVLSIMVVDSNGFIPRATRKHATLGSSYTIMRCPRCKSGYCSGSKRKCDFRMPTVLDASVDYGKDFRKHIFGKCGGSCSWDKSK